MERGKLKDMANIEPFEKYYNEYEDWFEKNDTVYRSELQAVEKFIPKNRKGVEIGVGTGRFALPLGIKTGVEPSEKMGTVAKTKGIEVVKGVAENLPLSDSSFDFALLVTTICFVENIEKTFSEAYRILKKNGIIIVGFVDKNSPLGKVYQKNKEKSKFYKPATFFSTEEVISYLKKTGFNNFEFYQTIFNDSLNIDKIQAPQKGYGTGSFVVIKGIKV